MYSNQFEDFVNQDFASFSAWLFSLNAYEFSLIAAIIGFIISPSLTPLQQNSLGNFFELLGQVLLTVSAQNITLQHSNTGIHPFVEPNLEVEIMKLKNEIEQLKKDLKN